MSSQVLFLNQPKISPHAVDTKFNERRMFLVPQIEEFISNHELFKNNAVSVTFSHAGVSSLVAILEIPEEKFVLKIPLAFKPYSPEGMFLEAWEQVGVSVPHVIENGLLHEHPYFLMKYIDAKTVSEAYPGKEKVTERIFVEMGKTLRQMHQSKAQGYGLATLGKPPYSDFKTWIEKDILSPESRTYKKFVYIKEHNLLHAEEHGDIYKALEILIDYVQKDTRSTYCHYDFGASNIFATKPLTVFDPDCMFNHPYIDLGRTIFIHVFKDYNLSPIADQIYEGYFGNEQCNRKVLQASILLNAYSKFEYWHSTNSSRVQDAQAYLSATKHFLE